MKPNKIYKLTLLMFSFVFILSACNTASEVETLEPIVNEYVPVVSATGEVVPERTALLSVSAGGVVAEVLVSEGETVAAGQVLVRLEGEERLQAVLSATQFELANAKYGLNMLYEDTNLLAAQALQAQDAAERALEDLLNPELQQALALKAIADAKKAVESAERRFTNVNSTADQADIDAAKSQVVLARDALDKAEDDFKPYENKPEDNLARANFQARRAAAQQVYDAAVRKLNALQGTGSEADIAVAEADLATARAQVSAAEREWERVKEGPNQADVALLEAQVVSAQRDYETYKDGPDPDDVAVAEARIDNAEAQLAAAEAALSDLELAAPFDGMVSELHINPSEWVAPGQPVLLLADLGHLRVETTDLGEIDVAQIEVGDTALVTFDALPNAVVEGTITRIAPKAATGSGVNYTVIIELSQVPAQLRWGMTAFVDIEVE
ncbi:MAG: HlyD family efflux transporter periplasmic adaptor subunit [Chloroflexi bacterium]|nr:HlyD family efflux transporter periplasmic adaptor subunit [Chloroflexota bacterium]